MAVVLSLLAICFLLILHNVILYERTKRHENSIKQITEALYKLVEVIERIKK